MGDRQSFPDISLLPELASYFDVTIDYLMDFAPGISKEETMAIYKRLSEAFAQEPFDEVYGQVKKYLKKYHNAYFLHLQMGNLLINHLDRLGDPARMPEIIAFAEGLFKRVSIATTIPKLKHEATYALAYCYLVSGKADDVIELLKDATDTMLPPELMLAHAHQARGDAAEARSILQAYVFQCLVGLLNACPALAFLSMETPDKAVRWFQCVVSAMHAFEFDRANPFGEGQMHLSYAKACALLGRTDEALDQLDYFTGVVCDPANYPVVFRTTGIFDSIDGLFEKLDLGKGAHRSDKTIAESCLMAVTKDPAFQAFAENERYKSAVDRIARAAAAIK